MQSHGFEVHKTQTFDKWLASLADATARARVTARLKRAEFGHLGDVKSIGDGVSEMRLDCGPGYRLYFTREGRRIVVLLCGGNKDSQTRDIKMAKEMAAEYHESRRKR